MNSPVIKPTVGRVVWFYPSQNTVEAGFARHADGGGPYAALIAHVWNDRMVNLSVFDANGAAHSRTSVTLHQGEGDVPEQAFCGWMPYQKGQAAKTEAAEKAVSAPAEYRQVTHREELERLLVSGAANRIAHVPEIAASIAKGIKTALDELAPVAPHPVASVELPVIDPGPDSLERAMESKTYQDGTTAFGPTPLPAVSPALWAKPLAKEVPELTVSLSDLGLEREIQAKALPPHQQRVLDEKLELNERLSKLDAFILDNPLFLRLPGAEQERLARQSKAMAVYSGILDERIAAF